VADRGLSLQAAGFITAMGFALTGPSNALGGYASDRLRNPPLVIGASLAVLACTSALLVVVDSIPLLVLVVAVNAVFPAVLFRPALLRSGRSTRAARRRHLRRVLQHVRKTSARSFSPTRSRVKDTAGAFTWAHRDERRVRHRRRARRSARAHEDAGPRRLHGNG